MKKYIPLTDQVRRAIENCGQPRNQIAVNTGVDPATLCRFVSGERGMSVEAMDKVGEYLGLRIVADRPRQQAKAKGR